MCSSNASTLGRFVTMTIRNSVSSRSGTASTRTSPNDQFDSSVFDYTHVSVQMAATLNTNCNCCFCARIAKTSVFEFHFENSCCSKTEWWILLKFPMLTSERLKPLRGHLILYKICRSYSDLNFGVTFLEHGVYKPISPNHLYRLNFLENTIIWFCVDCL